MSQPTQFLLYTAPDGAVEAEAFPKNETGWLTQKAPVATISKMEIVRTEGTREVANLRDTLLPKLLSGELRVNN